MPNQTITLHITAVDSAGATGSVDVDVFLSQFTLSASVSPSNAAAGTTRTLSVTTNSGTPPFTITPTSTAGITFTPAGATQWTFVY